MKRFKKILAVYEPHLEDKETIRRGVNLAKRNDASLIILNTYHDMDPGGDIFTERLEMLRASVDELGL
jgi:hypothetical protein